MFQLFTEHKILLPTLFTIHVVFNFFVTNSKTLSYMYINISKDTCRLLSYEPADLTVHSPPPPGTAEGGFIFFV